MTLLCLSRIALSHCLNTCIPTWIPSPTLWRYTIYYFCFQSQIAWPPCSLWGLGYQTCKFGIS